MPIEAEVKFDAGSGFVLPALDGLGDDVRVVDLPEQRLTATYVDTADLRLLRAGVTLRHRAERSADGVTVSEWTLKLPRGSTGAAVVRTELRWPGPDTDLPGEADALVRPWRRLEPLAPVARLLQARARTRVSAGDTEVLEIDDDVVSVMHSARLEARFRQVEVEQLADPGAALLAEVVARLESAGARRGDDRSKLERALAGRVAAPPDVARRSLRRRTTVADALAAGIADAYLTLADAHVSLLAGDATDDASADARAAVAAVGALAAAAGVTLPAPFADVASAIASQATTHRRLRWVEAAAAALDPADAPALAELRRRLAADADDAQRRVTTLLAGDGWAGVLDRLATACAGSAPAPVDSAPTEAVDAGAVDAAAVDTGAGATLARRALPELLASHHARLLAALEQSDPPVAVADDAAGLVAVAAASVAVLGSRAQALCDAASAVADAATDLAAADDVAAWLRREGPNSTAAEALAAGQLLAAARASARAADDALGRSTRRLTKRRVAGWLADG